MRTKEEKRWDRLFYSCPGTGSSNRPPSDTQSGAIVVDLKAVHRAAAFIERSRHYQVGSGDAIIMDGGGICIPVEIKAKTAHSASHGKGDHHEPKGDHRSCHPGSAMDPSRSTFARGTLGDVPTKLVRSIDGESGCLYGEYKAPPLIGEAFYEQLRKLGCVKNQVGDYRLKEKV